LIIELAGPIRQIAVRRAHRGVGIADRVLLVSLFS
jgi:hypothetical protein